MGILRLSAGFIVAESLGGEGATPASVKINHQLRGCPVAQASCSKIKEALLVILFSEIDLCSLYSLAAMTVIDQSIE